MIERTEYLKKLKSWQNKDLIKVVTGLRRCGKSTLFEQFIQELKADGVDDKRIININLEDPQYNFENFRDLYNFVNEKIADEEQYYVFLDEVQNVPEFQKAVDGLYIKKNVDVYITGSNAFLLSGELATLLTGRYVEIKMLPLSFKEYMTGVITDNPDKYFLEYLRRGGMPGNLMIENPDDIKEYLDGIFSTVVYKDIMLRNDVKDKILLDSIIKFLFNNVGNSTSVKKISDTLTSRGISVSNHTVEKYINSFLESYLIYKCERYDVRGKNILSREYKYYTVDTGLRSYLLGNTDSESDMGHVLENVVYFELLRRGYQVFVGKVDEYKVDFVAKKWEGLEYFQVSLSVRDENVLERELRSLRKTNDSYPKTLLTMDRDLETNYDGIRKINLVDWLLSK